MFVFILFIVFIIIYSIIRDSTGFSKSHAYVRASPRDDWTPVEHVRKQRSLQSSQHQVDVKVCSCGKWNAPSQLVCWNCGTSLSPSMESLQTFTFETAPRCAVCSFGVYPGEQVIICPACHAQGHRKHMLEYLKAKGTCPVCKRRFTADKFLTAVPIIGPPQEPSYTQEVR